jgi:hypothetical protein
MYREPNKKLSAKKSLPRVFYLALGTEKTLGKQTSLPRAKQKALGTEKNTRQRFLYQVPTSWLSAKNFFAKCNFLTPGKENFKNHFFASNFFLSSTYTYTKLMLKFGTILPRFAIFKNFTSFYVFFVCLRYELQVHEIIE